MNWKLKAKIQNSVSILPSSASYSTYYWIQRHFGRLRKINPISRLSAGIETCKRIKRLGYDILDKVFFEVGTGRAPIVPLAYWLIGAKKITTIDLNPYLKEEITKESIRYISDNKNEIVNTFGSLLEDERLNALLDLSSKNYGLSDFLDLCSIEYIAPGDAARTRLAPKTIDFHTSYTVLEHIPRKIIESILEEGNRMTSDDGLFVHRIDYSDHFSHSDKKISPINFLKFSDDEWEKYAGNGYMYMNRLRHDDFISIFENAGHRILIEEKNRDQKSIELVENGDLSLSERFRNKSEETISIIGSWIVSEKNG